MRTCRRADADLGVGGIGLDLSVKTDVLHSRVRARS
jgi:hypothetical protein